MLQEIENPAQIEAFSSGELTINDALVHIANYRNAPSITIPISWVFDAEDLLDLLTPNAGSGRQNADGIRFYASIQPGDPSYTLKLIAIGYKKEGNYINDMHKAPTKLYDFSRICPVDCDNSGSPLHLLNFFGRTAK